MGRFLLLVQHRNWGTILIGRKIPQPWHPFCLQTACKVYKSIQHGDKAPSSGSYVNRGS